MGGNMKDRWSVPVTAVANEFIDTYMAAANGEYVKVYLYVLRHQGEDITIELIADALTIRSQMFAEPSPIGRRREC